MSLDLINVGAEANDGTGDTPRAAFGKVNAAIAVVNALAEAPAPVDYSGAIATLATDVAALEAAPPPVTGWDYIGPTEPISPTVGFTWWERSAGGLTLGLWFWTGSLWADIEISSDRSGANFSLSATNVSVTTNIVISPRQNASGVLLERFAITFMASDLVVTTTDDWLFTASIRGANPSAASVATLFTDEKLSDQTAGVAGSFLTYSFVRSFSIHSIFAFNSTTLSPVLCRFGATKLNNAQTLSLCFAHLFWRYVR